MGADRLRCGICLANVGTYADPHAVARVAKAAEEAGWEGLFVWDHLGFVWGPPAGDPWILLAAAASETARLRLGTAVTPVARRRPQVLAQTLATLDHWSGGRVTFGAGLGGVSSEFSSFGEEADETIRAARLDEGLEVVAKLLGGAPVTHDGTHFTVLDVTLAPRPVQERIPIWIGGTSSAALARAARWDGWVADSSDERGMTMTTHEVTAKAQEIAEHRVAADRFDVAEIGYSEAGDSETPARYAGAGATWWLENLHDRRGRREELLARVEAGPPRL